MDEAVVKTQVKKVLDAIQKEGSVAFSHWLKNVGGDDITEEYEFLRRWVDE